MDEKKTTFGSTDPLSSATRSTKRNLLVAALVAITFRTFAVSIDAIPIGAWKVTFNQGAFEFLIASTLIYLLCTFTLYFYIDVMNFPPTAHQTTTKEWRSQKLTEFIDMYWYKTNKACALLSPSGFSITLDHSYCNYLRSLLPQYYQDMEVLAFRLQTIMGKNDLPPYLKFERLRRGKFQSLDDNRRKEELDAKKSVAQLAEQYGRRFPRKYRIYKAALLPRTITVATAYIIRNYLVDGLLPFASGIVALMALYGLVDLSLLTHIVPIAK